jgi:putative transcriptional regulator
LPVTRCACDAINRSEAMSKFKINNNIRKLRFFNDEMTQKDLAKLVGVTRQTINSLEKGKYSPSLDLAFRIALAFDVPLDSVFSYDIEVNGD